MYFGYWEVFPLQRKDRFMKRQALAFVASLACAGALVAAQSAPPPPQTPADPAQKPQEISLTGCLTQGSAPNVFILENAKVKPEDQNEKGATFVLVASKAEMSFKPHLNHSVKMHWHRRVEGGGTGACRREAEGSRAAQTHGVGCDDGVRSLRAIVY